VPNLKSRKALVAQSVALAVFAAVPALAATLTVTNTNDSGAGSLRSVLLSSASGDTIVFTGLTLPATITLTSDELHINNDLTITGPGASNLTISGGGNFRVFENDGNTVTISGMTIVNGVGKGTTSNANEGGAIYTYAATGATNLTSVVFSSNSAAEGGALWTQGTTMVTNCVFSGNTAATGMYSGQGGAIFNYGTLTVSGSIVSNNKATGSSASGGGIATLYFSTTVPGILTVTNSTISGNSATQEGGGINNGSATITVTNSTISGNSSSQGAGIENDGAGTITLSTISGNTGTASGGGIFNNGALTITNSTVSGNSAGGDGGGIESGGTAMSVSFTTISGNTAGGGGGITNFGTNSIVRNSILANNSSAGNCHVFASYPVIVSEDFNLSDDSTCTAYFNQTHDLNNTPAGLGALENNGGPTQTIALLPGSPAIDAVPLSSCMTVAGAPVTTDQRGVVRFQGTACDIGAFEVLAVPVQPVAAFLDQHGAPALTFNGSMSFPDAGGLLIGTPGVAQAFNGDTYVVGLDSAGGVHLNSYTYASSTWNGWQYSGGILSTTSGLTAAVDPSGTVWFTGRDVGNRYWINSWNGTNGFGGWTLVANGIFAADSVPQIAITSDGTVWIVGKDIGGRIWTNSYSPPVQTFTGWVDRQAVMIGQPSATAGQDGFVYVAVRSVASNSPVYISQIPAQNAATVNTWIDGGGLIDSDPYITSQGGTVYLTALADDGTVYLLTFAEATQMFGTWSFTGGILTDETIAAQNGSVFIAGRDSADRIYWYSVNGSSWFLANGAGISSTVLTGAR
jgi:predicted outer membrane repeat protein